MLSNNAIKLFYLVTIITVLLALTLASFFLSGQESALQNYVAAIIPNTTFGAFILTSILILALTIGFPRQLAAILAGYIFGALFGMIIATSAAIIGCIFTTNIARYFLHRIIKRSYPKQLNKVSEFFNQDTFLKAIIIRLIPAGSNFLTNVLAGVAKTPRTPYVLGSSIGFIPQMTVFSLLGAGLQINGQQQLIFSGALLVIALLLSAYVYKRTQHKLNISS